MNYKLVSCKAVIAKVITDLGLQEGNIPVSDFVEWCGEALKKIGGFPLMYNKVTGKEGIPLIEISNYQANLPRDCHKIIQVAYTNDENSEYFFPMKYATGSFEGRTWLTKDRGTYMEDGSTLTDTFSTDDLVLYTMELYDETYAESLARLNADPDLQSNIENLLGAYEAYRRQGWTASDYQLEYKLTPNYIKTNIQDGYLMISYYAIPLDEEGYPMIPDDESFKEAIFWYINMKLTYIDWRTNKVTKDVYYDAKNTWNFYVKQAYGNTLMPKTLDELESIKNAWVRLLPTINAHDNFFKNLDTQEMIKTHTT